MKKNQKLVIVFFSIIFTSICHAATFTPNCPEEISVGQKLSVPFIGWHATMLKPRYFLTGVSMYSDEPDEMSALKPDSNGSTRTTWYFNPHDKVHMACEYNQTSVQLTQALPDNTTTCTVWYNQKIRSDKGFVPEHVTCENSD